MPAVHLDRDRRRRSRQTCTYARPSTRKPTESGAGCARSRHTRVTERRRDRDSARAASSSAANLVSARVEVGGIDARQRLGRHGARVPSARGPSPRCEGARDRSRRDAGGALSRRALRAESRQRLPIAGRDDPLGAVHRSSASTWSRPRCSPAIRRRPISRRADQDDVEELVRSTGFFRSKAKNLIGMAQAVEARFGGEIPTELDDFVTLPGVGRKTGNVVRSVWFGLPGLPVDTHVTRLSHRLQAHRRGRPGEDRGRSRRDGRRPRSGDCSRSGSSSTVARCATPASRAVTPAAWPASARRPGSSRSWPDRSIGHLGRGSRGRVRASGWRRRWPRSAHVELARERGVGCDAVALGHLGDPGAEVVELGADARQEGKVTAGAHRTQHVTRRRIRGPLARGRPVR